MRPIQPAALPALKLVQEAVTEAPGLALAGLALSDRPAEDGEGVGQGQRVGVGGGGAVGPMARVTVLEVASREPAAESRKSQVPADAGMVKGQEPVAEAVVTFCVQPMRSQSR